MKTLAERFTWARTQAGLTKAELARILGVSGSAITQIEDGITRTLKASTIVGVEKATGVSGEWIVTGKGKPRMKVAETTQEDLEQIRHLQEDFQKLSPDQKLKILADAEFFVQQNEKGS